jgi:GNAT superfamily N-acetyltransferase
MKRARKAGFVVRLATLADLDVLVRHRRGMWEEIGDFTPAELLAADGVYRRWARARLRSGSLVGWIAERRGRAVASGCVWVQAVQPRPGAPTGRQPYLLSMFTEAEARGSGMARRIVRSATDWFRKQNYPRLTLHASAQGRSLYLGLGFERTWEMKLEGGGRRGRGGATVDGRTTINPSRARRRF